MRFGVGMNTDHTLEEVGLQFSVTRERIRQIEAKALRVGSTLADQNNKKLFRKLINKVFNILLINDQDLYC